MHHGHCYLRKVRSLQRLRAELPAPAVKTSQCGDTDMHALEILCAEPLRSELLVAVRHCKEARRTVRICSLLYVASGKTCAEAGRCFGVSPRAVELWVHRYLRDGIVGIEERPRTTGGTRKLSARQWHDLEREILQPPATFGYRGMDRWSGTILSHRLARSYGVLLSARQCRRMLNGLKRRVR